MYLVLILIYQFFCIYSNDTININLCKNETYYLDDDQIIYEGNMIQSTNAFELEGETEQKENIVSIDIKTKQIMKLIQFSDHYILTDSKMTPIILKYSLCLNFKPIYVGIYLVICYENKVIFLYCVQYRDCKEIENELDLIGKIDLIEFDINNNNTSIILGFEFKTQNWRIYVLEFTPLSISLGSVFDFTNTQIQNVKRVRVIFQMLYIMDEFYIYQLNSNNFHNKKKMIALDYDNDLQIVDFQVCLQCSTDKKFYYKFQDTNNYYIRYNKTNPQITAETEIIAISDDQILLKNQNRYFFENQNQEELIFDQIRYYKVINHNLFILDSTKLYVYRILRKGNYIEYINESSDLIILQVPLLRFYNKTDANKKYLISFNNDFNETISMKQLISINNTNSRLFQEKKYFKDCILNSQFKKLLYINDTTQTWFIQQSNYTKIIYCENELQVHGQILQLLDYELKEQDICQQEITKLSYIYKLSKNIIQIIEICKNENVKIHNYDVNNESIIKIQRGQSTCNILTYSENSNTTQTNFLNQETHLMQDEQYLQTLLFFNESTRLYMQYSKNKSYFVNYGDTHEVRQVRFESLAILYLSIKIQYNIGPNIIVYILNQSTIAIYKLVYDGQLYLCYEMRFNNLTFSNSVYYQIGNKMISIQLFDQNNNAYLLILDVYQVKSQAIKIIIPLQQYQYLLTKDDTLIMYNQQIIYQITFQDQEVNKINKSDIFVIAIIIVYGFAIIFIINFCRIKKNEKQATLIYQN